MYKVHGYLDNKQVLSRRMEHIPRVGDTARFPKEQYAKVIEVVWCLDEDSPEGQRVNIRMETEVQP